LTRAANSKSATRPLQVVIAVTVGALLLWGATRYTRSQSDERGASAFAATRGSLTLQPNAPQLRYIQVQVARKATSFDTDALPARVQIDQGRAQKVSVPTPGRVTKVFVEIGQAVQSGKPLFAVASSEVAGLRAEIDKAKAQLAFARQNLHRVRDLVAGGSLPAKEELEAQQEFNTSEIAVAAATAKLRALRIGASVENEFVIVAKRSGNILEKAVLPGQEVSPSGDPLIVIADLDTLWVAAEQPEGEPSTVKEGDPAVVTSPSLPGVRISGKVTMVSAVVDPERRTIPIRVTVENSGHVLKPNMYAEVRFVVSPADGSLLIPSSALVTDGQREFVFVQDGPLRYTRRQVQAGTARGTEIQVYAGVTAGERVVTEGALLLNNELRRSTGR
jgi:membrane fusion protein, heavy metal efflux system